MGPPCIPLNTNVAFAPLATRRSIRNHIRPAEGAESRTAIQVRWAEAIVVICLVGFSLISRSSRFLAEVCRFRRSLSAVEHLDAALELLELLQLGS